MLLYLCLCILFKSCRCVLNSTSSFVIGSSNLTHRHTQLAVGYDSSTDAILLFGGYRYPQHFTLFLKGNFLWGGTNFLFNPTRSVSQHYTQINHELWMIRGHGDGFITINTKTHVVTDPSIVIPTNVNYGACLTSTEHHLIVIGSGTASSSNPPTNTVQIYSINNGIWLDNVPLLNDNRSALSCAVVNDKVFAIGGWGYDPITYYHNIEVLDISESFTSWDYFSGSLRTGRRETRSVVYGAYIYVIGGVDALGQYPNDINMINTAKGECDVVHYLAYGVANGASIVVGNTLYVFGGEHRGGYEQRYEYITLPTLTTPNNEDDHVVVVLNEGESQDMTLTIALGGSVVLFICFGLFVANDKMKERKALGVANAAMQSHELHQKRPNQTPAKSPSKTLPRRGIRYAHRRDSQSKNEDGLHETVLINLTTQVVINTNKRIPIDIDASRRNVLSGIEAFSKKKSLKPIDADTLKKEAVAAPQLSANPPCANHLLQSALKSYRQFVMDEETDGERESSASWDD
eukprot:243960_1